MIIDPDMPDHWKTRMLVDLLGGDEMAPVYLIRLWGHCQNRKKCDFDSLPPAGLKALCRFQGDADAFDTALAECGFISRDGSSVTVCGWDEHNSSLVAAWENGKRGGRPRKPSGNPNETQEKPNENPDKTEQKPSQNPAETDREEKRREEKKGEENKTNGGNPPADDYTPEFEKVWAEYPKRAGANPKRRAFKAWTARLKDGEEPSEILAGVIRYAEFLKSTRKLNTEFVQQAATFFGPDRHYLEPWACPGAGQAKQFSETNYREGISDDGRLQ